MVWNEILENRNIYRISKIPIVCIRKKATNQTTCPDLADFHQAIPFHTKVQTIMNANNHRGIPDSLASVVNVVGMLFLSYGYL